MATWPPNECPTTTISSSGSAASTAAATSVCRQPGTRGLDQLGEVRSDGVRGQVSADAVPHLRAERGAVQQQEALRHQPTSRSAAASASRHGRSGVSPRVDDKRDDSAE